MFHSKVKELNSPATERREAPGVGIVALTADDAKDARGQAQAVKGARGVAAEGIYLAS